ncbi:MAG: SPASM domain-containing protein [Oligoflexia bacterium]|nr:SPASM domain-containing protein [Oligoflexia bacterium]
MYNSKSGAFASVPIEIKPLIDKILTNPNCIDANEEARNELLHGSFILDEDCSELEEVKSVHYRYKENKSSMILTLLSSENCNFKCPYCFIYKRRGFNMKPWVYDSVIKLIESNIVPDFKLRINFFGGEPTLAHRETISFLKQVRELSLKNNFKELKYSMVTNGYLLTKEKFIEYLSLGLNSFQITLDGDATTHDKTRCLTNGQGTYNKIWNNLLDIKTIPGEWDVAIRSNFLQGMDKEISSLTKEFNDNLASDKRFSIYFRPVYNFETERDDICSVETNLYSLEDGVYKQMEYNLNSAKTNGELRKEMLLSNPIPMPIPSWCDTEKGNFWVVGADGLLFKCDSYVGDADKASAKLNSDGTITYFDNYDWNKSVYDNKINTKCLECKMLPICQGGCPRLRKEGNTDCYFKHEMLETAMINTHKFHLENKGESKCLTGINNQ